jgi:catechol 2,3-dioxygenase-like lactoylglutathione lyase family enzyme
MHMLHHLSLGVSDLERSAAFYDAALAPLGYVRVWTDTDAIGYGNPGGGDRLALRQRPAGEVTLGNGFHLAFSAPSRESTHEFHAAALRHGGQDNGAPELCLDYGPTYYAAFVIDPDGYRIEAVINE